MNQLNMNNLLCHINETIIKNESKGEIGLIVDDISPVLRYLFPVKEKEINLKWEKSSFKHACQDCKKLRLDFILYSNGIEIGCGEVKICDEEDTELIENVPARMAETMKRQLHIRILNCRDEKEMKTFGILFKDHTIELYTMSFNRNAELPYQLYKVMILKIPNSRSTYTSMDETMEFLLGYKNAIISSLQKPEDIQKPLINYEYSSLFKPTLVFKKEEGCVDHFF
ncbi:hypothetical protein EDC94DRAFT_95845 [Helicostylum pulchrum]|nr:hypothetical protein EDC94DRAFT_95845 [Helicostylum pulchrum]